MLEEKADVRVLSLGHATYMLLYEMTGKVPYPHILDRHLLSVSRSLRRIKEKMPDIDLVVFNQEGVPVASTLGKGGDEILNRLRGMVPAEMAEPNPAPVLRALKIGGERNKVVFYPYLVDGKAVGSLAIISPLHKVTLARQKIILTILTLWIIGIAIYLVFGFIVVRVLLIRPIQTLVTATRAVASGDLSKRVDISSEDEIGELAKDFNAMAQRLQDDMRKINLEKKRAQEFSYELEVANKELKKTQAELIQAAKMVGMGQLGASIAHELNQPLLAIGIFAERSLKGLDPASKQYAHIQKILTQVERMTRITNNIRMFSRQSKAEKTEVNVNEPIEDALMMVQKQLENHNIEVVKDLAEDCPKVMADKNQLHQVFLNMITNARDAMDPMGKGKLTIRCFGLLDDQFVEIDFIDTGVGIPEEIVEKIFHPFFTTKEDGKGVGLGLSLSHEIIKNHSGMMDVRRNEGGGTIFRILLPSVKAKPCWEEIGCGHCLKDMNAEDCPVYKRGQGHRCWEILGSQERRECHMPVPNCQDCPFYKKRSRLLAWGNSTGLGG
ncbi:MAG: HAMP domain-containing protein [Deltaproteobacteria bacterium]|nr:HAMP domain-containing protein [Deltaproteobacteria bacterium]